MLMLPRGETKNKRSHGAIAAWMGDNATVSEPDETGVFRIDLESPDRDTALSHAWNAVGGSGTADHVMLLDDDDLPERWRPHAGKPRAGSAADQPN